MRELYINLQLFAGDEKTEQPTGKKRQDARKKGQVLQSKEISSSITLLISLVCLKFLGKDIFNNAYECFMFFRNNFLNIDFNETLIGYRVIIHTMIFVAKGAFVIILVNFAIGFFATYMQVGNLFTTETLKFDLMKLNPLSGLKRMVSLRSLVELIKSMLKLIILAFVAFNFIKSNMDIVLKTLSLNKFQFSYLLYSLVIDLGIRLSLVLLALAAFDYLYQWYEFEKNLKMSKQEIKEEYKQMEGDPQIKSKIKQKQRESALKRMMQDVPSADVIITNPTHFAVAVKYDELRSEAPFIVAKGTDLVAQKIKEVAKENDVPIVENKPLARELYSLLEIGDSIPPNLYEAIAQILAYVYSLKK